MSIIQNKDIVLTLKAVDDVVGVIGKTYVYDVSSPLYVYDHFL